MKLFLQTIVILMSVLGISSCSDNGNDDYKTPTNLVGTTWKSTTLTVWDEKIKEHVMLDENMDYVILKYTSANGLEYWTKYKDEEFKREWIGTYAINSDMIVIKGGDPEKTISGTIKGVTMDLMLIDGVAPFSFILQ